MVSVIFAVGVIGVIVKLTYDYNKQKAKPDELNHFRPEWREFLEDVVDFYKRLKHKERIRFENEIIDFLTHIEIKGSRCKVLFER